MQIRKITRAGVIAAVLLSAAAGAQQAQEIKTLQDLLKIGKDPAYRLDGHYALANDSGFIDAGKAAVRSANSGKDWEPIGSKAEPFTGEFYSKDGKTFVIRGLNINKPDDGNVGLFGVTGKRAIIMNIGVEADTVIGSYSVGALAGRNDGHITGCYSSGIVKARRTESNAGGLTGVNAGTITKSFSTANVEGREAVGGLTGFLTAADSGKISESYALGDVSGTKSVGGLVGHIFGGKLRDCFAAGKVTENSGGAGGLAGADFGSQNTGWNVQGAGGTGKNVTVKAAEIVNCFWDMDASGQKSSAGAGVSGKATDAMISLSTFRDWNMDSSWDIAVGSYYPHLKWIKSYTVIYRAAGDQGQITINSTRNSAPYYYMTGGAGSRTLEVTAKPNAGYSFAKWSDGSANPVRSDIISGDTAFQAQFVFSASGADACTLSYAVNDSKFGKLKIEGTGFSMESPGYTMTLLTGEQAYKVTAAPAQGCRFVMWSDGSADSVRQDIADASGTFTAVFAEGASGANLLYTVESKSNGKLRAGNAGGLLPYHNVQVRSGTLKGPFVAAVPDTGWRFLRWNDSKGERDEQIVRSDNVSGDRTILAVFEPDSRPVLNISSRDILSKIGTSEYPLDAVYKLTANIDASGLAKPIGTRAAPFKGVFVGNGYRITGLNISAGDDNAGLFGYADGAVIRGVDVSGTVNGKGYTGVLVGRCVNTVIDSCRTSGTVGGTSAVGGLAGGAYGSLISRSYSTVRVEGAINAGPGSGGLAGTISGSIVTLCYSTGAVSGGSGIGGLAGVLESGIIQFCYTVGRVGGVGSAIGGFVGEAAGADAAVYQCYSGAIVTSGSTGSGFAGAVGRGASVSMCYYDVDRLEAALLAEEAAVGRKSAEMSYMTTYAGWDSQAWAIDGSGKSYPYLRELRPNTLPSPSLSKSGVTRAAAAIRPAVSVRGRTMRVSAGGAGARIRLIDMKGKTVMRRDINGGGNISLTKIPSGRYIAEITQKGRRAEASAVLLR